MTFYVHAWALLDDDCPGRRRDVPKTRAQRNVAGRFHCTVNEESRTKHDNLLLEVRKKEVVLWSVLRSNEHDLTCPI